MGKIEKEEVKLSKRTERLEQQYTRKPQDPGVETTEVIFMNWPWAIEGEEIDKLSISPTTITWTDLKTSDDCLLWQRRDTGLTFHFEFSFYFHLDVEAPWPLFYLLLFHISENYCPGARTGCGKYFFFAIVPNSDSTKFSAYGETYLDFWYSVDLNVDTPYYAVITRDGGDEIVVKIYSDPEHQNLIESHTIYLYDAAQTYSYMKIIQGINTDTVYQSDGWFANLILNSS